MQFTPTQKRAAAWTAIALLAVLLLRALGPVLTPFLVAAVLAYAREHPFAHGFAGERLDAFDQCVACVDVDAGVLVREGGSVHAGAGRGPGAPTDRICA